MSEDDPNVPPAKSEPRFVCPRCRAFAAQDWIPIVTAITQIQNVWDTRNPKTGGVSGGWSMSRCQSCGQSAMWRESTMIYPLSSSFAPPSADMPADAAELYNEARAVLPHSRRAGAALARASLERLLKSLDPEAGRMQLDDRIARMAGQVSSSLADLLTVVRHVGNKSVHVDDVPDDLVLLYLDDASGDELAEVMFEAINELVDERITKPKKVSGYFDRLPAGVRETALRKLGRSE